MNIKTRVASSTILCCAKCGGDVGSIDHLANRETLSTAWYCDDCGIRNHFTISGGVVTEQNLGCEPEYAFKKLLLAEARKTNPPLRFIAEGVLLTKDPEGKITLDDLNNAKFWLEENTVVTNWLRVEAVFEGDDSSLYDTFSLLAAWGPGDTDALASPLLPDNNEADSMEAIIGGEDIFDGDDHVILYRGFLEMLSDTDAVRDILFEPSNSSSDCYTALRNWSAAYGGNPRAWYLLANYHRSMDDDVREGSLSYVNGVYDLLIVGRNVVFNTATGDLKVTTKGDVIGG